MEIRVESFFGVVEIAHLPDQTCLSRTTIGSFTHFASNGEVLVTVDNEQRRILYAHYSVTVTHTFQGVTQSFQGIWAKL